jgi:hypothetical protein
MTTPPERFDHEWERRLHEQLRRLPDMEAPAALVPGIMAAIQARQGAAAPVWYRRPATAWPPAARAAFGTIALALFGLAVFGLHLAWPWLAASVDVAPLAAIGRKLAALWSIVPSLAEACLLVLRQGLGNPWFLGVAAFACFAYLTLLGAGGALWRVALRAGRA